MKQLKVLNRDCTNKIFYVDEFIARAASYKKIAVEGENVHLLILFVY